MEEGREVERRLEVGGGRRCSGKKKKMSVFEGDDYLRSWELERRFMGRGRRILIDSEK